MVKFFVICLRKFFKNAYLKKCERNENLNFKFGFSVEFRVDWYVLIMDLYDISYIHLPELLYEIDNCVGVNEKAVEWMQDYCKPNTNTYHSTRNSTLDPIVKSKFPAHVFHPCTLMKVDCHNLRRQITLYLNDS